MLGKLLATTLSKEYRNYVKDITELLIATALVNDDFSHMEEETILLVLALQAPFPYAGAVRYIAGETIKESRLWDSHPDPVKVIKKFFAKYETSHDKITAMFWSMLHVAYSDNCFDTREQEFLETLQAYFQFPVEELQKINLMVQQQRRARGLDNVTEEYEEELENITSLEENDYYQALAVLMCTPEDSPEKIKKKFRFLCKQYHPDSVSQGSQDQIEYRTARFRQIQDAYALVIQGISAQTGNSEMPLA